MAKVFAYFDDELQRTVMNTERSLEEPIPGSERAPAAARPAPRKLPARPRKKHPRSVAFSPGSVSLNFRQRHHEGSRASRIARPLIGPGRPSEPLARYENTPRGPAWPVGAQAERLEISSKTGMR